MFVQLDHTIYVDLSGSILVRGSVRGEVLRINGRLLTQPQQEPSFHFWFRDQRIKGLPVLCLNVWDEGSGI